jgi:2-alkyl-3-oxoalkanoate reductase
LKHFDRTFHNTSLLRTRGTDALVATAQSAGVTRFVIQSYASARCVRSEER